MPAVCRAGCGSTHLRALLCCAHYAGLAARKMGELSLATRFIEVILSGKAVKNPIGLDELQPNANNTQAMLKYLMSQVCCAPVCCDVQFNARAEVPCSCPDPLLPALCLLPPDH